MEESKFTNIEPGTYYVTCIDVKEDTIPNPKYGSGDVIKFTIQFDDLEDDEGNQLTRETMASDYLTSGSKLTTILRAFGVTAEVGHALDMDDCIGKRAQAEVGSVTKTVKGEVKTYDTIEKMVALPKVGGRASAATRPAQEPVAAPDAGAMPAVIMPDGISPDFAAFWRGIEKLGLTRKHAYDKAGGMDRFGDLDGPDLAYLLEELRVQVEAAV